MSFKGQGASLLWYLDRLTAVSGACSQSYYYNPIGNITSLNGNSYTYGSSSQVHAVTAYGSTSYAYDANGNMTARGSQTLTWDYENKPLTVSGGSSYYYDGDGTRVEEIDGAPPPSILTGIMRRT